MPTKLPFRSALITGGDGFVGRFLIVALAPRLCSDARLTVLGSTGATPKGAALRLAVDLRDRQQVERAVRDTRPDLIIHLAAQSSVAQASPIGAGETWAVNLGGTLNLAQACAAHDFNGTFLFTSSAEVYGGSFLHGAADEATRLAPQSAYARSKAAAEAALADILPPPAQLIVARPGNHSGPGQQGCFVLPAFATQIAAIENGSGETLRVGNLEAARDFLDVRDVVNAYLAILASAGRLGDRVVLNVASGRTERIATLLERLLRLAARDIKVEVDPARLRPSDIANASINADRLRQATGWRPTYDVNDMLCAILAHARQLSHPRD
jgi:GDP-4-dehydro-6-deoxy-D-mannose reductase